MEAIEKLIKAIGAVRAAGELLTHGRLDEALAEIDTALAEAVEQAKEDAERDAE